MKILVVAALANELNRIKLWIKWADIRANIDIDYLCTGVWNYEVIYSLEEYLKQYPEPVFIFNIWLCWYWNSTDIELSNPIQIASIINIHSEKEIIIPPFLHLEPLRTCFSSESIVFKKPILNKEICTTDDEMFFDMESRWIEFIATKHKFPCVILKVPFDLIWRETKALLDNKQEFEKKLDVLKWLPYKNYLQKIIDWMKQQNL